MRYSVVDAHALRVYKTQKSREELAQSGMNPKGNGTETLALDGPMIELDRPASSPTVPWVTNELLARVCGNLKEAEILRAIYDPDHRTRMRRITDSMNSYNWQVRGIEKKMVCGATR